MPRQSTKSVPAKKLKSPAFGTYEFWTKRLLAFQDDYDLTDAQIKRLADDLEFIHSTFRSDSDELLWKRAAAKLFEKNLPNVVIDIDAVLDSNPVHRRVRIPISVEVQDLLQKQLRALGSEIDVKEQGWTRAINSLLLAILDDRLGFVTPSLIDNLDGMTFSSKAEIEISIEEDHQDQEAASIASRERNESAVEAFRTSGMDSPLSIPGADVPHAFDEDMPSEFAVETEDVEP